MLNRFTATCLLAVTFCLPSLTIKAQDTENSAEAQLQEIVGSMIAAYVIESHASIGLIADSYVGETLAFEDAEALIEAQLTLLNEIGPRIFTLSNNAEVNAEGQAFLKESGKIFKAIRSQLTALREYINSDSEKDHREFLSTREKVQAKIDEFFNSLEN